MNALSEKEDAASFFSETCHSFWKRGVCPGFLWLRASCTPGFLRIGKAVPAPAAAAGAPGTRPRSLRAPLETGTAGGLGPRGGRLAGRQHGPWPSSWLSASGRGRARGSGLWAPGVRSPTDSPAAPRLGLGGSRRKSAEKGSVFVTADGAVVRLETRHKGASPRPRSQLLGSRPGAKNKTQPPP